MFTRLLNALSNEKGKQPKKDLPWWPLILGQKGSSLFAIPFAIFGQNIQWFGLFVWILGSLQQWFLASENLRTLRYIIFAGNPFCIS